MASWASPGTGLWGCADPHWVSPTKVSEGVPIATVGKTSPEVLVARGDPRPCTWPLAWGSHAGENGEEGSAEEEEEEGVRAPTGDLTAGGASRDPGVTGRMDGAILVLPVPPWVTVGARGDRDWGCLCHNPANGAQVHPPMGLQDEVGRNPSSLGSTWPCPPIRPPPRPAHATGPPRATTQPRAHPQPPSPPLI